jgi:hypothetical protein
LGSRAFEPTISTQSGRAPPPAHAGESAADDKADISNALGDAFWDIEEVNQNGSDVPEDVGGVLSGL